MRLSRVLALGASVLVLFGACSTGGSKPTIKIGSDGFDEAKVVAEVYAQVLEANGYTVDRAGIGLGTRKVTAAALESGQIDLKPEYIGSGLAYYAPGTTTTNSDTNAKLLADALKAKAISVLAYTPGQDTNAFVVRKETADQYKLDEVERPDGRPERAQVGARDGLPDEPGLRGRRSRPPTGSSPTQRHAPGRLQRARWPMRSLRQDDRRGRALLDRARDHRQRLGPARGRQETQPADNIAPIVRERLPRQDRQGGLLEAPRRRVGQDRHGDPGRPVQAGRGRQEGPRPPWPRPGSRPRASSSRPGSDAGPALAHLGPPAQAGGSSIPGTSTAAGRFRRRPTPAAAAAVRRRNATIATTPPTEVTSRIIAWTRRPSRTPRPGRCRRASRSRPPSARTCRHSPVRTARSSRARRRSPAARPGRRSARCRPPGRRRGT